MEQYTSLLQKSARLRNPDAEPEPVEQPEPEVVEEEVAEDEANFRIITAVANLFLDNDVTQSVKQTDNRRIYRDTGSGYPVKEPTTSGYGIDVVWQSKVFVASSESSPLTEEEKEQLEKAARDSGLIPALL